MCEKINKYKTSQSKKLAPHSSKYLQAASEIPKDFQLG